MLYTKEAFNTILKNCNTVQGVELIEDYLFTNAVKIIKTHGGSFYNLMVFKCDQLAKSFQYKKQSS